MKFLPSQRAEFRSDWCAEDLSYSFEPATHGWLGVLHASIQCPLLNAAPRKSWGQSWGFYCWHCFWRMKKNKCSFKVHFLLCLLDKIEFSKHKSLAQEPHSVSSYFMSFIQPFSFKKRKKRNLPTQSELLLNLYLSLVCHVNYIPNKPHFREFWNQTLKFHQICIVF